MKRVLLATGLLLSGIWANAQSIVTTYAQHKSVVLEEYTGIHCVYCPDGHKRAKEMRADYPGRVVLINVHEGSFATPGGNEPDFRTPQGDVLGNYFGVNSYPSGTVNRRAYSSLGLTTVMGRGNWRQAGEVVLEERSAVNIGATTSYNSSTRTITVNVEGYYTMAGTGTENYLNIALLEDSVVGPQTGGSTYNPADVLPGGKYKHDHVFRGFLTGQWGDTISNVSKGALYTKTFTYVIPDSVNNRPVDPGHCDLAIYVTEDKQNVIQGITLGIDGDSNDGNVAPFYGAFGNTGTSVKEGTSGTATSFSLDFTSTIQNTQDFKFKLMSDAPSSWSGSFTVNSNTYNDSSTINLGSLANSQVTIDVTPGSDAAVANYTLMVYPTFDPANAREIEMTVISGITELIVNSTGGWGDGNTYNWDQEYESGLSAAGSNTFAVVDANLMEEAFANNALSGVTDLYLNIGWRFPSLTDAQATEMMTFLDNGGNLFIAGQDLGWDINDASGYGTPITKNFYTNYLNAAFVADGSSSNSSLIADSTDMVFGSISTVSNVVDKYAGSIYPDELNPINGSQPIFYYNSHGGKVAGLRSENGGHKVVYLGIGIEMIADATVRDKVVQLSYDWFRGKISTEEFDLLTKGYKVYPNPSAGDMTVEVPATGDYTISLSNASGQEVFVTSKRVIDSKIELSGMELPAGIYMMNLTYKNQVVSKKVIIR